MQTIGTYGIVLGLLLAGPGLGAPPAKKLSVVATTPDLAAIAMEIGGAAVDVKALAKPTEDPHYVDPKPSFLVMLNRADVLIEGGAELELGWLPPLVDNARNSNIAVGAGGRVVASEGIRMLEIPATFDRSKGDIHGLGNPHYLLDPLNAKITAAAIAEHFVRVAPAQAAMFKANLERFNATVDRKLAEWQKQLAPFRGAKIVTYHRDFVYLSARFDLETLATLEPKPGIPPSPAHLAQVIGAMRTANARVILVQPFQNHRTAETVARQTDAVVLDVPQQPGVIKGTATYFELMDYIVKTLAAGLGAKP